MFARFLATLEIARPHNMAAASACVGAGFYLSGGRALSEIFHPLVFTAIVTGLGNMINDYFDAETDSVNKPRRPIPSRRLSRRYVLISYVTGTAVVNALLFRFLTPPLALVMILWQGLLYYYARRAKRLPLIGNVLIGAIASSAFFAGALITGNFRVVVFPMVLAFVFVMGREFVKGAEDVEGDSRAGAATLAVRIGVEKTVRLAALFLLAVAIAAPTPGLASLYGRVYALCVGLAFVPGILVAAYLLKDPRRTVLNRVSWILKFEMFVGIVAMALGLS